jgi:purine-binding chemotaxis protein CheW
VEYSSHEVVTSLNEFDDAQVRLVVFSLDGQRYALHLSAVEKVVRTVLVTPLPGAPLIVLGVINAHGQIIPVIDVRRRFGLSSRETTLSDSLILAHTPGRIVALGVDSMEGLLESSQRDIAPTAAILPNVPYLNGVVKLDDGLVLIHDLASFLSLDEEQVLDVALSMPPPRPA